MPWVCRVPELYVVLYINIHVCFCKLRHTYSWHDSHDKVRWAVSGISCLTVVHPLQNENSRGRLRRTQTCELLTRAVTSTCLCFLSYILFWEMAEIMYGHIWTTVVQQQLILFFFCRWEQGLTVPAEGRNSFWTKRGWRIPLVWPHFTCSQQLSRVYWCRMDVHLKVLQAMRSCSQYKHNRLQMSAPTPPTPQVLSTPAHPTHKHIQSDADLDIFGGQIKQT